MISFSQWQPFPNANGEPTSNDAASPVRKRSKPNGNTLTGTSATLPPHRSQKNFHLIFWMAVRAPIKYLYTIDRHAWAYHRI
jgi:hypothetical protein